MLRHAPLIALIAFVIFAGCGDLPSIPTIDQIRTVPDASQVTILEQSQFSPQQGPIGQIITINGRGKTFPAGIVAFSFSGTGGTQFDLPEESATIKVKVPINTISGPFGFTISGRDPLHLENSLPSSNLFKAYRFDAPGFTVVEPTGIPDSLLTQPDDQHAPPNG